MAIIKEITGSILFSSLQKQQSLRKEPIRMKTRMSMSTNDDSVYQHLRITEPLFKLVQNDLMNIEDKTQ